MESYGNGINGSGQITGESLTTENDAYHAFIYSDGRMIDLGTLGGQHSVGYDINAAGDVTGNSNPMGASFQVNHAFLYSHGSMTDLNDLIDPTLGWTLDTGLGINDAGHVTGVGTIDGTVHAFLLSPVPEPEEGCAMLLVGVGLVGWMAGRPMAENHTLRALRSRLK